ncbi:hypothetical protein Sru01_61720 [Sphaerisporangium rufum]|uniref:Uncharacterized protein n=1 Tax=Sphaerisporangium rufum TaxID=1381558 RepID=A0A919RAJ4_9ACTN|nr:hypothetical protein [Sphaerisporangium rufum]GII81190.1 hypothetical protein Sru01_61720 [Sphaerisporangium rufum]
MRTGRGRAARRPAAGSAVSALSLPAVLVLSLPAALALVLGRPALALAATPSPAATATPAPAASPDPAADRRAVYCLAAAHRPQVAEAAVSLGLGTAVPDRPDAVRTGDLTYSVDQWRTARPEAFERACTALLATVPDLPPAERPDEPGVLVSTLGSLGQLLAGSLLTLLVQRLDARAARRRQRRDALAQASGDFRAAAYTYIDAWIDGPATAGAQRAELERRRDVLADTLRRLPVQGRRRAEAEHLAELVTGYPGPAFTVAHGRPDHDERQAGREERRREVAHLTRDTEALIDRHIRDLWSRAARPAAASSGGAPAGAGTEEGRP